MQQYCPSDQASTRSTRSMPALKGTHSMLPLAALSTAVQLAFVVAAQAGRLPQGTRKLTSSPYSVQPDKPVFQGLRNHASRFPCLFVACARVQEAAVRRCARQRARQGSSERSRCPSSTDQRQLCRPPGVLRLGLARSRKKPWISGSTDAIWRRGAKNESSLGPGSSPGSQL